MAPPASGISRSAPPIIGPRPLAPSRTIHPKFPRVPARYNFLPRASQFYLNTPTRTTHQLIQNYAETGINVDINASLGIILD